MSNSLFSQTQKKTIFIPVSRGYIMRNVLRSGVLDELKRGGVRVVILLYDVRKKGIPGYLKKEFEDEQVILEAVAPARERRLHRRFNRLVYLLLYNSANLHIDYIASGKSKKFGLYLFFRRCSALLLRRFTFLKAAARSLDKALFFHGDYRRYFEKYKPDVVFSTSVVAKFDIEIMKEAERYGISTVAMPRVWDNITTKMYRFIPDRLLVQNDWMKEGAIRLQDIPEEKITVCGFPQFDWCARSEILMNREEYCALAGLDPKKKIIVFGANNKWTPEDGGVNQLLAEIVNTPDVLDYDAALFVRAHFSNAKWRTFQEVREQSNVVIDTNYTFSDFFLELCDPDKKDIQKFINMLYHADAVVTFCSSLALDAIALDKPVINVAFGGYFDAHGKDISQVMYNHDHYHSIIDYGAVDFVRSKEELIQSINEAFQSPGKKRAERQRVIDEICYKIDGKSSERIAKAVLAMLD